MERELLNFREIIGDCDREIIQALKTRMECIGGIIQYKRKHGMPVLQPEQERKQLLQVQEEIGETIFGEEIVHIFERIMENSRKIQAKALFDRNILLIGFMGAGKSTVSAYLGKMLAMETIEMDGYIEEKEGMKISQIFDAYGEEYFRNCESNTLIELQNKDHAVISCGGGVPLRPQNVELMKKNGYVVWLTAKPEEILERVKDGTDRPLLNGNMNIPFIDGMMESRKDKYSAAADVMIDTTGKGIGVICEELLQKLSAVQNK